METVCLGVDVGGTNLRSALVSADGQVLERYRLPTDIALGREAFLERLLAVLGELKSDGERSGRRVAAVGLGVPGLIANDGYIHSSVNLLPLEGINLAREVSQGVGLPVVACNDANASAIGELRFGAGRPFRSLLALTLGTGVGSGLILDGRLWTGIDGVAGEFGHVTVEPEGFLCACGNRGCLEQYASASAIAARAARQADADELRRDGPPTAGGVALKARAGDAAALEIYRGAGRYLGIAVAGAVNLLNLEAVILGGGVAESFDLLVESMRAEIRSRAFALPGQRVTVLKGELGDDAGLLGSAALAFERV